jgi:hypothetical protein
MAKAKLNSILEQVRGKVGDLVFRHYGDKVVVSRAPDFTGQERTAGQLAMQERFRQATQYAKLALTDPAAKAVYEAAARATGRPLFSLAVADFLHTPSADEVDLGGYTGQAGDPIAVRASDDCAVTGVSVELTDAAGQLIETGTATEALTGSGCWIYTATTTVFSGGLVHITVTARDRPGNTAVQSEVAEMAGPR